FKAEVAYGFPAANDRLTLTPGVAVALSPTSRSYSLLWSLALPTTSRVRLNRGNSPRRGSGSKAPLQAFP
ncbi:MAG: hypothetical protein OXF67_02000, partial [Cyanobacteria bacterium MAG CAR4_bin_6]|nr:hypothetical protein [Cyanobacteria bacterium MAG CAR4_bin_6]